MFITQKCQYGLKAIFELSKHRENELIKIHQIAKSQKIPVRFLEVILSQLRQGGFIDSKRGSDGGYFLVRDPRALSVGEVIRFIQGPFSPIEKDAVATNPNVFQDLWKDVNTAISNILEKTTFQSLVVKNQSLVKNLASFYAI